MARKDLTLRYAVIQFCFWVCFAEIVAFSSVYLLDRGLTNTQIGGRMIDTLGIGSLITVGIVVSACGSALMILAMTRKEKKEQVC